ncbi:hypothetical protein BDF22DRAFT_667533 [Syncephalis plumigaleata]|nr:hypothetical protein BDF22DRAFT_667533 [Syncephalis plumigaleata]
MVEKRPWSLAHRLPQLPSTSLVRLPYSIDDVSDYSLEHRPENIMLNDTNNEASRWSTFAPRQRMHSQPCPDLNDRSTRHVSSGSISYRRNSPPIQHDIDTTGSAIMSSSSSEDEDDHITSHTVESESLLPATIASSTATGSIANGVTPINDEHDKVPNINLLQSVSENQQYITLRLNRPAIVCSITFGKYKKATLSSSNNHHHSSTTPSAIPLSNHANESFLDLSNDSNDFTIYNSDDYDDSDDAPDESINMPMSPNTTTPLQNLLRSLRVLNSTTNLVPIINSLNNSLTNQPNRRQQRQQQRRRLRHRQTNAQHRRDNRRNGFILAGNNVPANIDTDLDAIWRISTNTNTNNNNNNNNNNTTTITSSGTDTDTLDPIDYLMPPITNHVLQSPFDFSSPSHNVSSPASSMPSDTTSPISSPKLEHVCNMREFRVYGGPTRDYMPLLLHDGLRNDTTPETFRLRYRIRVGRDNSHDDDNGDGGGDLLNESAAAYLLPCEYIRIEPASAWGQSANISIWYVELHGIDDPEYIQSARYLYKQACEEEATRICLRYLQKRGFKRSFDTLMAESTIAIGEPDFSEFYKTMVNQGDWLKAETILNDLLAKQQSKQLPVAYHAEWTCLYEDQTDSKIPCARGGHQMCIDAKRRLIYLFGGWNGTENLNDLWYYNIEVGEWTLIHRHTSDYNGPPPSSCHQMSYDTIEEELYVFGRFVERKPPITESDVRPVLYAFNTRSGLWRRVQRDTQAAGGPPLLYDHQMIIDSDARMLYISGGRIIRAPTSSKLPMYAGLYAYDIQHDQWQLLCDDLPNKETRHGDWFNARSAHSMTLDTREKMLYLFCGQRHGTPLIESIQVYDIRKKTMIDLSDCLSKSLWPLDNAAQRSTMDIEHGLIHFITGLTWDRRELAPKTSTIGSNLRSGCDQCQSQSLLQQRHRRGASSNGNNIDVDFPYNEIWVFNIVTGKWTPVQVTSTSSEASFARTPVARYAFQTVYDPVDEMIYMFGGNPKDQQDETRRLNDLWRLKIQSQSSHLTMMQQAQFLLRRQCFIEMCRQGDKAMALNYLQTKVYAVTNHMLPASEESYRSLAALLFQPPVIASPTVDTDTGSGSDDTRLTQERTRVYEMILKLITGPQSTPNDDLTHLVPLC